MGIDDLLEGGRWFEPGERDVCILPSDMAALVGIGSADVGVATIRLVGKEYRVIGIIDAERLNRMVDLDGEKLTPVDMLTESGS
ncbi:MAG: ABC transporter permease, partial [Proteobacteria bacterium]|nr:ABC transporter permease [Pseudomonadota bacterium]